MKIIDEMAQTEVFNPDLEKGYLYQSIWASPEAYASVDNVTKFALDEEDYEEVLIYHVWTEDELEEQERQKEFELQNELRETMLSELPDIQEATMEAIIEIGDMVASQDETNNDMIDAFIELGNIVAELNTNLNFILEQFDIVNTIDQD